MRLRAAEVRDADDDRRWIVLNHEDGPLEMIPLQAVVTYAETLGHSDAIDAIEAACVYREEVGGEFPCEEQYLIIEEREAAREEEASRCVAEKTAIKEYNEAIRRGCDKEEARILAKKVPETPDPRSPQLRGALAARKAVMDLTGCEKDSESALVKAQAEARRRVRSPDPDRLPSVASRHKALTADVTPHSMERSDARHLFDDEDRRKLSDALRPHSEELQKTRDRLLHVLSRRQGNPFGDEVDNRQRRKGLADVKKKYQA